MQQPSSSSYFDAFVGTLRTKRWSLWYSFAMLLVAFGMLLLPLFYVSLTGFVGYLVWYHLTANATLLLGPGSGVLNLLLYVIVALIGVVLVFFMLKPLFAPRLEEPDVPELPWTSESRLFAFVCALCHHIGAPTPSALVVDCSVNASAGFRRGGGWLPLQGDLMLHIGLPLVAGLSVRQFAGILAHEFGHFTQAFGMRLTFLVRAINVWFARVVFERDVWDARLDYYAEEHPWSIVLLPAALARLLVRVVRGILWVLMMLGHVISSMMLRQMEFDADRYAAHVSGSDDFERTLYETHKMDLASELVLNLLQEQWSEGRMCQDVPALIAAKAAEMPDDVEEMMIVHLEEEETGLFDTHPSSGARIREIAALGVSGSLQLDGPASQLFADFDGLSRDESLLLYQRMFGEEEASQGTFFSADALLALDKRSDEEIVAGARVWRRLPAASCPCAVDAIDLDAEVLDDESLTARLRELRDASLSLEADALDSLKAYLDACEGISFAIHLRELLSCEFPVETPEEFGVPEATFHEAERKYQRHKSEGNDAFLSLGPFFDVQRERAGLCFVRWLAMPDDAALLGDGMAGQLRAEGGYDRTHIELLLATLDALFEQHELSRMLLEHFDLMQWYIHLHQAIESPPSILTEQLFRLGRRVVDDLGLLRNQTRGAKYPFAHASGECSVGQFLVASLPPSDEPLLVLQQLESTVNGTARLYVRAWGALSRVVEAVEDSLGFAQMDAPEDPFLADES